MCLFKQRYYLTLTKASSNKKREKIGPCYCFEKYCRVRQVDLKMIPPGMSDSQPQFLGF